ncbi:MAG: Ca-activated chloride channel family protein [Candidatus Omnitrophota bacterium]|jgi:Ca-activated chloride channel homolog
MMHKLIVLLLIGTTAGSVGAESFYTLMKEAAGHYKSGALDKAEEAFTTSVVISTNDTQKLTLAQYNLASTKHRLGNFPDATTLFGDALNHEDPKLRSDAYYNRGLSLLEQSKTTEEAEQLDEAIMQVSTSMGMFEQSLELNPEALDAKTNLELSYLRHEALMEKKKEQEEQEKQDEENKDENKDENEDEEKKDQDQQDENEDEEKKDQDQQDQEKKDEQDPEQNPENNDQEQQEQEQSDESKDDQAENQPDESNPEEQPQPEEGQPGEEQQMTPEEADMLLDALREKEKADRARFRMRYGTPPNYPVEKPY